MKNKRIFATLLLAASVLSCTNLEQEDRSLSIQEAKLNFEANAKDLRLVTPLFYGSDVKSAICDITPHWEDVIRHSNKSVTTIMVPIMDKNAYSAALTVAVGNVIQVINEESHVESHLVIQKRAFTDEVYRFICTVIGVARPGTTSDSFLYTGDRTDFEGYMLLSTEEGDLFKVLYYKNGIVYRLYKQTDDSRQDNDSLCSFRLGAIVSSCFAATKGGGAGDGYTSGDVWDSYCFSCGNFSSFGGGFCSICGAVSEEIGNDDWYYFCSRCGYPEPYCNCDNSNGETNNNGCPICGESYCSHNYICPFCCQLGCSGECVYPNAGSSSGDYLEGYGGVEYAIWKNLSYAEKIFVINHPAVAKDFWDNATQSSTRSKELFPATSGFTGADDARDAFRHAFWSALNAYDHGVSLAREYGTAHEEDPNQTEDAREMDLNNNGVGYNIGEYARSHGWGESQIEQEVLNALNDGRLIILL